MCINIEFLKKKIIYRSTYRGTKEMDTRLSSFTEKYINKFSNTELKQLLDLLNIDDENLYKFNLGEKIPIKIENNSVSQLFSEFVYTKS
jgi:antitoxin CptB